MVKLYDKIKTLLQMFPEFRDSDSKLIWDILERKQLTRDGFISKQNFLAAPNFKSISRARRMVQADFPELKASKSVQRLRDKKQDTKGTFSYREEI